MRFLKAAALRPAAILRLINARPGSSLHDHLLERSEAAGALVWPYQCSSWSPDMRISRIAAHYETLDRLPASLRFRADDKLVLADLRDLTPDVSVILDRPRWFMREGELVLNIFKGKFRAYSLAFSIHGDEIFVGAIQGRSTEGTQELYRSLTKEFHGVRPRDLLVELLRILARPIGVKKLHAVAEEYRVSRDAYFGCPERITADYDEVWRDRGGVRADQTYFRLPLLAERRCDSDIPARKRSMYRRRYAMFDSIENRVSSGVCGGSLVQFEAT